MLYGRRADDAAIDAQIDRRQQRIQIAQAAAQFNLDAAGFCGGDHGGDGRPVHAAVAVARCIQVDQMDQRSAVRYKGLKLFDGIARILAALVVVALVQTYDLAIKDIDCWNHLKTRLHRVRPDHRLRTQRSRKARPARSLFSGWNWVARRLSFLTTAGKEAPA